uniref:Exopolygalacturonase n=1 Tax=Elaeis guineensis var. tenera TaxID=51953 RepID=A0A6I9QKK6_ELAGV|nr:polygalacturonase-like [Elaeis guineensis]
MAQLIDSFLHLLLLLLSSTHYSSSEEAANHHNVIDYGAKPDGETDSTKAFLDAWDAACGSPAPATILVPAGFFLVNHVTFHGPCKSSYITVQIDGTLVAPTDYANFGKTKQWMMFNGVQGVSVSGGTIDGRGKSLWDCKNSDGDCPEGSTSLTFRKSKNVTISGLRSRNSELYHMVIEDCEGVTVQGAKIEAPEDSPNTDGIHIHKSTGVTLIRSDIGTGDDCVSVGPDTTGLWIEQVTCGPGHGISIGSLGKVYEEKGVENVTVKLVELTGTTNGLRIKSWGRPSTGFVNNVLFQNVTMQNVKHPIIIDQNYCPHHEGCPGKDSGIKISQVSYSNIRGSSATEEAVTFNCSAANPCNGIRLEEIELTYRNEPAKSSCDHAQGTSFGRVNPPSCLQ